ncbi:MAG: SRPBCC domain-containing protein [Chitinophagaceae bacterium]|nr:SRPBCC domain-containing protein [Chitinophagaceae bacterium]
MENSIIEATIEINAPLNKVWSVFTNPDMTKQMGGYYDTDWKIGSSFSFRKADGDRLTNGTLLDFQPMHLIKHDLFEPNSEIVMAVLTYEFHEKDGITLLTGKEELSQPLDKATFDDASAGWASALNTVKQIAEAL